MLPGSITRELEAADLLKGSDSFQRIRIDLRVLNGRRKKTQAVQGGINAKEVVCRKFVV